MAFSRGVWFSITGNLRDYDVEFTTLRMELDVSKP